jgi:hypothetical protein
MPHSGPTRAGARPANSPVSGSTLLIGIALAVVFVAGLALRLDGIRRSLWLDEFSTLWAVEAHFADVIARVPQVMQQTPFYFSLAWASVHFFGESELALRLPSLLAVTGSAVMIGLAGAQLGGRKAGAWSAAFFWLCYPAIWASVNSRPYPLAMFFASVVALGFIRTCLIGRPLDRALWIVGAGGLVWAHYIFLPFMLAFPAAYFLSPTIRMRYPTRQFLVDLFAIELILLPAAGQFLAIVANRESLKWMHLANYIGIIGLFAPFSLAALLPGRVKVEDAARRDLQLTLWLSVIAQVAGLETASFLGLGVVNTHYASVIIVPLTILAGVNICRLTATDRVAPLAIYAIVTAAALIGTNRLFGSPSGAGYEQWRDAVATLRPEVEKAAGAPVLFRSGNAEDDHSIGEITWGATLAPLRSPGQTAPDWNIILLTYRWFNPARPTYFEQSVARRLAGQPVFFLLCLLSDEPGSSGYCPNVEAWIDQKWPGQFHAKPLGDFQRLWLVRFDRLTTPPDSRTQARPPF